MGGIAAIAKTAGYKVTGCDANVYPPMSTQLGALGIDLVEGFGVDQIALNPDVWVVGNVVTRGNPLMEAILDRGDRYMSGPAWLSEHALAKKWVLAIAGTHGKTTTSAMLAWVLECAGLRPGFLIGGAPLDFPVSARLTDARHFVIEADEYDTAFFDKRSKFVHYPAKTAVLNNLEFDHADIFHDLAAIERQFHHFIRIIPSSGLIVANARSEALKRVIALGCWTNVEWIDDPRGWQTSDQQGGGTEIAWQSRSLGRLDWQLMGEHNRLNALAALAAARHAGVEPGDALGALGRFQGVRRRMERRGIARGVTLFDDFAHHPSAIQTTIEGLRAKVGAGRILAVLEPRSNTMRLGAMKDRLAASLADADRAFIYSANLGWDAEAALAPIAGRAHAIADLDQLVEAVAREARSGDCVLVMSNGGFGGIHAKLLERLAQAP